MPTTVLFVLIILVGAYGILAGAASLGFILARREPSPSAPSEWPPVSVVMPTADTLDPDPTEQIQDCDYPTDRLEILIPANSPVEPSGRGDENVTVRHVSVPERPTTSLLPSAPHKHAIEAAEGEIVLTMPTEGATSSGWIRSMVRRCTPDTPIVVGPTVIEHEGLFLPRLQALSHLGRLAFTTGASHFGVPNPLEMSNRAVRVDASKNDGPDASSQRPVTNPEADAVVARSAVDSFESFLHCLAQGFRRAGQSRSWLVRGQGVGLWLVHSVLLACAIVAVAVPAWRQPTLLALVAKMGADVVLTLPAAKHYGQRGLFRSLVPTELMLVLALPVAGLWAVIFPSSSQELEPIPG